MNAAKDENQPRSSAGPTVSADQPWPGLLSFQETDEQYFKGRRGETEALFRLVTRERLTVLFGLSGLGKSSLLQAGLFPLLRAENLFPVHIRFDLSVARPNLVLQTANKIASEAVVHGIECPAARPGETLWEYFHRDGNHFWSNRNRPLTPVLVFDQFEELFTLGRTDSQRSNATESFIEQLADLAELRPPAALKALIDEHPEKAEGFVFGRHPYKLLLAIREDFLPDLEGLRTRMPSVALTRFRLQRMSGAAAFEVVSQAKHLIEQPVAEAVVRFVAADRDYRKLAELEVEPALLSVVCRELNTKRIAKDQPTITGSLLEGAQDQVLAEFYERSVSDLPLEIRYFIEDKLLTISGYRDSVALENALSLSGITRESLDELVERRIIRREDRGGSQRLELTHDLLAGVVRESRDNRRKREKAEQETAQLLRVQEEELKRSREEQERRIAAQDLRRFKVAAVVFLSLTLVAAVAAVWATMAQRQADVQRTEALTQKREALRQEQLARQASDVANKERLKADRAAREAMAARDKLAAANALAQKNAQSARQSQVLAEKNAEEARRSEEAVRRETQRANEMAATNATLARILLTETRYLFDRAAIRPERRSQVEQVTATLVSNRPRYEAVSGLTGVPWHVISILHMLESSGNFGKHFHNGDPLTARTVNVPKDRPDTGEPPFTWEESAADAIRLYVRRVPWKDWSIPGILLFWELYNGRGYRNIHGVRSPFVWACTDQYTKGAYGGDAVFDPERVPNYCGAAAYLKRMIELQLVPDR